MSICDGAWEDERANLDIHEVIYAYASKLRELLSALFQELGDRVTFLALDTSELAFSGLSFHAP